MNSQIEEIKNRLDIVDVIRGYINLQKAGNNYKAVCPFHSEKTPSLMVSPEKQIWHCFGCGKGGSIFDFVMEIEGVDFGDALKMLAQRAGVKLDRADSQLSESWKTERTRLYEICDLASRFFVKQLEASQTGQKMIQYLKERGLKEQTIKDWQIGYAPGNWQSLVNFLNSRGYSGEELVKAGLAVKSEKSSEGKYYDRFRERIIFPLKNINGTIVGFSGRENPQKPSEKMGKYINTPNTLIYDKSKVLYGLDKSKLALRKKDMCIIVEGQMDVIMSHQAGFDNVIASSGTAVSPWQLKIINRYTENLATAFDMDIAGETATKRGIDLAVAAGLNTKVISLSGEKDPADYIRKDPSLWEEAINKSKEVIEFYFDIAFSKYDTKSAEGKKKISKLILPIIKKIPNHIEQAHWLQELGKKLMVSEKDIIEEMKNVKEDDYFQQNFVEDKKVYLKKERPSLEEYSLGFALAHPEFSNCYQKHSSCIFSDADLGKIFEVFKIKNKRSNKINLNSLKKSLEPYLSEQIDYLMFKAEAQKKTEEEFSPEEEVKFCFNQLRKNYFKRKLSYLNLAIAEAEDKKDRNSLKKLTEKFNKIASKLVSF